jgi:hypothetical protein
MATTDARALPDVNTLEKAAKLIIFDKKGDKVEFGTVFSNQKTVVVFIREFIEICVFIEAKDPNTY